MNGELDDIFSGAEDDLVNAPPRHRGEAERQKDAREAAEKEGWLSFKWSSPKHGGVLDVLYFRAGVTVAIEYKVPGGKPTPLQEACMRDLSAQGIPNYCCFDVDDTLAALSQH